MGCPQEGVRCPGTSDLCLNQRLHQSTSLQPVTHRLQCCHQYEDRRRRRQISVHHTGHWPLSLNLHRQSKQRLVECDHWSLARVEMTRLEITVSTTLTGDKKHTPLAGAEGLAVQNRGRKWCDWGYKCSPHISPWCCHCICTVVHMECEYFSTTDMIDK